MGTWTLSSVDGTHNFVLRLLDPRLFDALPKAFSYPISPENLDALTLISNLKELELLPETTELRQVKYLNNLIEQDHRFIKKRTNRGLGFSSFNTAR